MKSLSILAIISVLGITSATIATQDNAATSFGQTDDASPHNLESIQIPLLELQGSIVREPEAGLLTIPESAILETEDANSAKQSYTLKCDIKDNLDVDEMEWLHYINGEWQKIKGISTNSLDVAAFFIGDKHTSEGRFRCQIQEKNKADFIVFLGSRSETAKKKFKIKKFKKSYDIEEGQDFTIQCSITNNIGGDLATIEKELDYKWYRWSESYDMSFGDFDHNCTMLVEDEPNSKWLEIDGLEKKDGELEPHIQLLNTNLNTIKIEDAQYEDRRGYMCVAYNRSDASICSQEVFFVRVKEKYPAIWPFIGIVAEVVILCIIIFVCERRKVSKQAKVEEFNGNDLLETRGGEVTKIRQRRT